MVILMQIILVVTFDLYTYICMYSLCGLCGSVCRGKNYIPPLMLMGNHTMNYFMCHAIVNYWFDNGSNHQTNIQKKIVEKELLASHHVCSVCSFVGVQFGFLFCLFERNERKINKINNSQIRNSMCGVGDGGDKNQQFPGQWTIVNKLFNFYSRWFY